MSAWTKASHMSPGWLKRALGNLPAQVSHLARGTMRVRVPALLYGRTGRSSGKGQFGPGREPASWTLLQAKLSVPRSWHWEGVITLVRAVWAEEWKGKKAWQKFHDQVSMWPKPSFPAQRACTPLRIFSFSELRSALPAQHVICLCLPVYLSPLPSPAHTLL